RVDVDRVLDRALANDVARADAERDEPRERPRAASPDIAPNLLPGRRERRVRQRETERLGDHLRRRCRAEELATASGRRARAAAELGRLGERDLTVRETDADRLHLARVLAVL